MARTFASAGYFEYSGVPVAAVPLTIAGWYNTGALGAAHSILCLGRVSGNGFFRLILNVSDSKVTAQQGDTTGAVQPTAVAATTFTTGVWQHAAGVFATNASRTAYMNGAAGTAETTNVASPPTPLITNVGVSQLNNLGLIQYFNGSLAEIGVWADALTAAEIAVLATGASPLMVRPGALVAYWPLVGRTSPEIDLKGGRSQVYGGGSVTTASHPRVIYPRTKKMYFIPAAAAGGFFGASARAQPIIGVGIY